MGSSATTPGLGRHEVEVEPGALAAVEATIERHKRDFRDRTRRSGLDYVHWPWPAEPEPDLAAFFVARFKNDPVLQRLFRKT